MPRDVPAAALQLVRARERQALDGCESELADLFGAIPRDFPNMQFDQQSDGTTRFVATKEPAPDANKATKEGGKSNDGEPKNSRKA